MAVSSVHTGFREDRVNGWLGVRFQGDLVARFNNSSYDLRLTGGNGLTVDSGGITITAGGLTVTAGGAGITGDVTVTGDINPEADGTRDLGTQTTAQWANVWSDLVNGADFGMANGWRLLESELYGGYSKGFAIGHSEKWESGKAIWAANDEDKERYMDGETPVFAVTDEFLEFKGQRITPEQFERLVSFVQEEELQAA